MDASPSLNEGGVFHRTQTSDPNYPASFHNDELHHAMRSIIAVQALQRDGAHRLVLLTCARNPRS